MQPTELNASAVSALATAPAVLELAESSRWRAPEVTAALAEQAVQLAQASGDRASALRAEAWLAHGLVAIGRGVAAVPRAVHALSEAGRVHEGEAAGRLRVELASVARTLGDLDTALALLAPALEYGDASLGLRADAHLEAARCGGVRSPDEALESVGIAAGALRQLGGEYAELGLAVVDAVLARQQRERGQVNGAMERAREGLRRVLGGGSGGGALDPVSPHLAAELTLELALALLEGGQVEAVHEAARAVLRWGPRPGALVSVARLRLILAQRVYLPAGEEDLASAAAEWVAKAIEGQDLPEIEVECHGLLAEIRERRGELPLALAASRRAHEAYRLHTARVEQGLVLLARAGSEARLAAARRQPDASGSGGAPEGRVGQLGAATTQASFLGGASSTDDGGYGGPSAVPLPSRQPNQAAAALSAEQAPFGPPGSDTRPAWTSAARRGSAPASPWFVRDESGGLPSAEPSGPEGAGSPLPTAGAEQGRAGLPPGEGGHGWPVAGVAPEVTPAGHGPPSGSGYWQSRMNGPGQSTVGLRQPDAAGPGQLSGAGTEQLSAAGFGRSASGLGQAPAASGQPGAGGFGQSSEVELGRSPDVGLGQPSGGAAGQAPDPGVGPAGTEAGMVGGGGPAPDSDDWTGPSLAELGQLAAAVLGEGFQPGQPTVGADQSPGAGFGEPTAVAGQSPGAGFGHASEAAPGQGFAGPAAGAAEFAGGGFGQASEVGPGPGFVGPAAGPGEIAGTGFGQAPDAGPGRPLAGFGHVPAAGPGESAVAAGGRRDALGAGQDVGASTVGYGQQPGAGLGQAAGAGPGRSDVGYGRSPATEYGQRAGVGQGWPSGAEQDRHGAAGLPVGADRERQGHPSPGAASRPPPSAPSGSSGFHAPVGFELGSRPGHGAGPVSAPTFDLPGVEGRHGGGHRSASSIGDTGGFLPERRPPLIGTGEPLSSQSGAPRQPPEVGRHRPEAPFRGRPGTDRAAEPGRPAGTGRRANAEGRGDRGPDTGGRGGRRFAADPGAVPRRPVAPSGGKRRAPEPEDSPALSVPELAVKLAELANEIGRPPHLILVDVVAPDGLSTGPAVPAVAQRIGARVRDQLPPGARLYRLGLDAMAVGLPETDPSAVTRWVRSVSTGLSQHWSTLAADLPGAVFRIGVRWLGGALSVEQHVRELRAGRATVTLGPPDEPTHPTDQPPYPPYRPEPPPPNPEPGRPRQPVAAGVPPRGRHVAGHAEPDPFGAVSGTHRVSALPGTGGRRRRPEGMPGVAPAVSQNVHRADAPMPGGPSRSRDGVRTGSAPASAAWSGAASVSNGAHHAGTSVDSPADGISRMNGQVGAAASQPVNGRHGSADGQQGRHGSAERFPVNGHAGSPGGERVNGRHGSSDLTNGSPVNGHSALAGEVGAGEAGAAIGDARPGRIALAEPGESERRRHRRESAAVERTVTGTDGARLRLDTSYPMLAPAEEPRANGHRNGRANGTHRTNGHHAPDTNGHRSDTEIDDDVVPGRHARPATEAGHLDPPAPSGGGRRRRTEPADDAGPTGAYGVVSAGGRHGSPEHAADEWHLPADEADWRPDEEWPGEPRAGERTDGRGQGTANGATLGSGAATNATTGTTASTSPAATTTPATTAAATAASNPAPAPTGSPTPAAPPTSTTDPPPDRADPTRRETTDGPPPTEPDPMLNGRAVSELSFAELLAGALAAYREA